ncbi:AAA family ATPase [Candidatus Woesearchaeota archaeon]|nr:AAA family ATPase [Candidatus Woesearchaeota archaeon]
MIIGLTGSYGAGKDEIAHYLESKGFIHYSLSDLIREELIKEKKEITRANLIRKGNQLREQFGPSVLALKILPKLKTRDNFVISSIRNTKEISALKKRPDFILIYVDAPSKLRFKRTQLRQRTDSFKNFEDFKQKELIEQSNKKSGQQLHLCKKVAKIVFINKGSLEELHDKLNTFLKQWQPHLPSPRPSWDEYFLEITRTIATRSTCDRGRVGCIIVKNRRILTTGYAGSPSGTKHCDEIGHLMKEVVDEDGTTSKHCVRTTHAEQNAIVQAARYGISIEGSTIYCIMEPCHVCAKLIINAGITRVVCEKRYHAAQLSREIFKEAGIKLNVVFDETEKYTNQ